MSNSENTSRRPLMEPLEESFKNVMQNAKFEDRTVNQAQYEVMAQVYKSMTDIIGGAGHVTLHPAFSSGGISIAVECISLSGDEVSALREALAKCSTLSIEPLTNGNVEIGVTIPDVFYPLEE